MQIPCRWDSFVQSNGRAAIAFFDIEATPLCASLAVASAARKQLAEFLDQALHNFAQARHN